MKKTLKENYKEYAKGLSNSVLIEKQKHKSDLLENHPYLLRDSDRDRKEMELDIINEVLEKRK